MDYFGIGRSNYFKVKDPISFSNEAIDVGLQFIKKTFADDITRYGCIAEEDWPSSYIDKDDCEQDFDIVEFIKKHLADGEVAVLMTTGYEGTRILVGQALAIAWDGRVEDIDLEQIYDIAAKMKGPDKIVTRAAY
ncbi:MAG: hypothetical protein OEY01_03645 [Desulfobulbaceae bacterium]|nr:hypothetical protein [Desulfobulbaceae bacterium]